MKYKLLISTLFALFSFKAIDAQISANTTSGCAPLTGVLFSNSYTNPTNINWDFDDGASSNLPSPSHTFALAGTYNVVFTATVGGSPVTDNITINVYNNPVANFQLTGQDNGCAGLQVTFNDNSTGGSGSNIIDWQWAFGDGGVNNVSENPTYTYNVAGIFDVALIVTDANGCVGSTTQNDIVTISAFPTVNISSTPSPPSSCEPPLIVDFNSTATSGSPLGDNLTYAWDFDNGQTSNLANPPATTYSNTGTYQVTLIVTDDNECSVTLNPVVGVSQPIASFSILGGENDTVCSEVFFVNESTGTNPQFNYGDGEQDNELTHIYEAEGWYDITLTVNNGSCTADTTITVFVQIPTVDIILPTDTICTFPVDITAYANSPYDILTYDWISPNGNSYTTPSFTEELTYFETEYYINYLQSPPFNLTITTTDGCTASAQNTVVLFKPNALFFPYDDEGCAPLATTFEDFSTTSHTDITQWIWNFGDGSPNITNATDASVSHTYQEEGIYNPFLIVVTENGCRDTSWVHDIFVGTPPNASFTLSANEVCIGEEITLTDTTPLSDNVDTWNFSGDENLLISCQDESSATVSFDQVTGATEITMTVGYRGCYTTATENITVVGPTGKLKYSCNCDTPFDYPFEIEASDATSWDIDFGDGQAATNTTATNITHTYAETGNYWAVLTLYNTAASCPPYIDSVEIKVRDLQVEFTVPDSLCAGVPFVFSSAGSQDVAGTEDICYNSMVWYFGGNNRPKAHNGEYSFTYTQGGTYDLELWGEDINGCVDSASKSIQVFEIEAGIDWSAPDNCLPLEAAFQSTSTSDLPITNYTWSSDISGVFGNTANVNYTFTTANFIGNSAQPYEVILDVSNAIGCTSSDTIEIQPNVPNANFQNITPNNICAGGNVTFDPTLTASGNGFEWTTSNGLTSSVYNPNFNFADPGQYSVTLTVTNGAGCTNTSTQTNYVNVQAFPQAGFETSIPDGEVLCYPVQITFTDTSIVNPFGSRIWNLGNGAPSVGTISIGANYNTPGDYTITLIELTTAGCADTASLTISVEGPVGDFTLSPSTICRGDNINLAITDTSDVASWGWDFGDGTNEGSVYSLSHQYAFDFNPPSGQTLVSLVLWNQDSICSAVLTEEVDFIIVNANFLRNEEIAQADTMHCVGIPDVFINTSSNNADVYNWDFGNGQTFVGAVPPVINYAAGTYNVTLAVETLPEGCVDTISKTMIIHPLPNAVSNSGQICLGENFQLEASGGEIYSWTPGDILNNDAIPNPIAFPEITTEFVVTVTDTNQCVNTASSIVQVFQPLVPQNEIYTIIIGEEVEINIDAGPGYSYEWTPDIWLACNDCPEQTFQPLEDTTYFVTITDDLGCFEIESRYEFIVLPLSSVDVPDVFTPNGDGINDIIYVRGWGIEDLISFQIYNRWGELVFESKDADLGWNGNYKGEPQQADTYAYVILAKAYIYETPIRKEGFINIIR